MKNLYILEILLLSQRERKAKKVTFDRYRTLIYGGNSTGKSSLIKSIYKTFGAEPVMHPNFVGANVISCVKFEMNDTIYQIIRDGKRIALFDSNNELIKVFDSVTKELAPYFSNFFDFKPLFQSHNNGFIVPPPAFLLLPFYIDQDESWSKSWASFKNLQQVKDYRNQCIYYHSGIRPNKYYTTKKELDVYSVEIEEAEKEQKITKKLLDNVKEKLSQSQFNIDIDEFKQEITDLLSELEILKNKEEQIKSDLHNLYHIKATYEIQINIIKQAILESHKDLAFAIEKLPEEICCPTCGAEYYNSFAERFEIAQDEQKSKDLLLEVNKEAKEIDFKIETETQKLTLTSTEIEKIDTLLESRKGDLELRDIIESSGKNQVKQIFSERYDELKKTIVENKIAKEELENKLKSLESKKRRDEISNFYQIKMTSFFRELDVNSLNFDNYKSINAKIESLETGSSRPRALIAYYFTFFHLMKKYSSTTYFPLIIDSPNQQDQDIEHIDKIFKFIHSKQPQESQMILGLAENYGVDFKCEIVNLEEPYSLLQEEEFDDVYAELNEKIYDMWQ